MGSENVTVCLIKMVNGFGGVLFGLDQFRKILDFLIQGYFDFGKLILKCFLCLIELLCGFGSLICLGSKILDQACNAYDHGSYTRRNHQALQCDLESGSRICTRFQSCTEYPGKYGCPVGTEAEKQH